MKPTKEVQTRPATIEDLRIGTILIMSEGYEFKLTKKVGDGFWEMDNLYGGKIMWESEVRFYHVKIS